MATSANGHPSEGGRVVEQQKQAVRLLRETDASRQAKSQPVEPALKKEEEAISQWVESERQSSGKRLTYAKEGAENERNAAAKQMHEAQQTWTDTEKALSPYDFREVRSRLSRPSGRPKTATQDPGGALRQCARVAGEARDEVLRLLARWTEMKDARRNAIIIILIGIFVLVVVILLMAR